MTPKHRNRRIGLVLAGAALLAGSAYLLFTALAQNVAYFYTPSQLREADLAANTVFRLGGLVEEKSVRTEGVVTVFRITDGEESVPVSYAGILPDLFREGQGVIAQGRIGNGGVFDADTILAKHDENYVPRELKDVMEKASGRARSDTLTP